MFQVIIWVFVVPILLFFTLSLSERILTLKKLFSQNHVTAVSAGLLTGLTFFKFLPHSLEEVSPFTFSIVILFSLILLLLIESYLTDVLARLFPEWRQNKIGDCSHYHQHHHHFAHGSFSAIGCLLICSFFDGVRMGAALWIDSSTSVMTFAALFAHILPEGLAVLLLARNAGKKGDLFFLKIVLCFLFGFGILLAGVGHFEFFEHLVLMFSTASLFYVVFIHLLPVAFEHGNKRWFFSSLIFSALTLIH